MAGLFGYEKGHREVSMKMGERGLFPAVREAGGRVVVVPGTSYRGRSGTAPAAAPSTRAYTSQYEGLIREEPTQTSFEQITSPQ